MLIAINRHLVNKASGEALKEANGKFENVDVTPTELAALIDQGFAFCAQHEKGWRKSANFTVSGFLAVDIDHGLNVETVLEDPYFQEFGSLLYTTPSHTTDAHRFRVVFELESPIDDAEALKRALTGLIVRFGADGACSDPCRLFFGSQHSAPIVVGKRLPAKAVEELQVRADESRVRSTSDGESGKGIPSAVRSRMTVAADATVRTSRGEVALLRGLPPRTSIFCPNHIDNRPSAFTLRNRHDVPGLSCSTCKATFFVDDGSGVQHSTYRFDYHWNSVLALTYEQYSNHMDEDGNINMSAILGGQVRQWSEVRYLPYEDQAFELRPQLEPYPSYGDMDMGDQLVGYEFKARADITLIKSPKGSGKTEWLKQLVSQAKATDLSVLLIGHRRALISATAERIGLTSYLAFADGDDDGADAKTSYRTPNRHYAVCVDSLEKLDTELDRYDIVLIDEVEQVFAHLLSATLRERRRDVLMRFQYYLKQAGALYLLDADLNHVTVKVLDALLDDDRDRNFQVLLNWWQPNIRTIHLYDGTKPDPLIGELIASLTRGERCFVCSNSKKFVDSLEGEVERRFDGKVRPLKITSENSQKPEIQAIVRHIRTRALDYQVIFTSPALGTGIDITFEDDASLIDAVYGFFQARINTHFDIDQQLSRVRNPKRVNVWISPQEFEFETDDEAIKAELLASGAEHRQLLRIKSGGRLVYDDLYDTFYAAVTASERASKNRLRKNFIELRKSNGWSVETVGVDKETSRLGKEVGKAGKEALRRNEFERILAAPQITSERYVALKSLERQEKLKDADKPAMRRYEIEAFYRCDATLDLLEADDEGRLRDSVRRLEMLMDSDDALRKKDRWDAHSLTSDQEQGLQKKQLLVEIFTTAGIMRDGAFDPEVEIESSQLRAFSDTVLKQKAQVERYFSVSVRADVGKKPVRQLQDLLGWMGLILPKIRIEQTAKTKRYFYALDADRLRTVSDWAAVHSDPHRAEMWRALRDDSASPPEEDSIPGNPADVSDPLDRKSQVG
ncbi:plasmid replication protein, CyRepA1 family [Variovorax sp. UMC13]|uniref:plasmid replication protein, CyRepA1 family n=1 Tax=Variovorax sp. UMC13 TaxID=1862326 RepID=UPI0016018E4A|nr:plasmid replication protein, CyRepA1 family [Variovorax sp. UMC13]MBB1601768.1 hypothetical protein [Variovorax sp. UMC13]